MISAPALIDSLTAPDTSCDAGPGGIDLFARWDVAGPAVASQLAGGLDHRARVVIGRHDRRASMLDRAGRSMAGLNFASVDYLGLSHHDALVAATVKAAQRLPLASGGAAGMTGLSPQVLALERRVADCLGLAEATVFTSGSQALQAATATLLRPGDHAIIDRHAHPALKAGARLAGAIVHSAPHASLEAVERRLRRLRHTDPDRGILVATAALFPTTASIPDLTWLVELCRTWGATLLVDVAHDFGSVGTGGRGVMEVQGLIGRVDIVVGSFAKTFGCNGGFVASRKAPFHLALRLGAAGQAQSAAMSPLQAAVILSAFDIVFGPEGTRRRARLMANALRLRNRLVIEGFHVTGQPAPLVSVVFQGALFARAITAEAARRGVLVNLLEQPHVARHAPRWRVQLMSEHTIADIDRLAEVAVAARALLGSSRTGAAPIFVPTGIIAS